MGIFRRQRRDDAAVDATDPTLPAERSAPSPTSTGASSDAAHGPDADGAGAPGAGVTDRAQAGPFDRSEVESQDGYVDLGSLWLPAVPGLTLTMEVDESTGDVTAVRVHRDDSVLQLQAFAAPKSSGIWDEIRDELVAGITAQGGTVDVPSGPLGTEVLAQLGGAGPDGRSPQVMRFLGVDGPRWFLRGVISGDAAADTESAAPLVEFMRAVVVVRGSEPMGPRELLGLVLPPQLVDDEPTGAGQPAADEDHDRASTDDLNPFVRGPEITETR